MAGIPEHFDPSQSGILLDALRDIVGPQLYRTNSFRVSGLCVTTEDADMYSQLKKLEKLARFDGAAQQGPMGCLPLQPPPDLNAMRNAGRRLHDMESRLVDEFFWFWPVGDTSKPNGDAGLELLRRGDVRRVQEYWSGIPRDSHNRFKASHNLAVLYHALALDIEYTAESQTGQLGSGIQTLREEYWQTALRYWVSTVGDEALWVHMASRADVLDDPRLRPESGFIDRLRQSLPEAISSISVDLAVRAAKHGDTSQAKQHMTYIRESGFDRELIERLLDREVASFVDQIHRTCKPVEARYKSTPGEAHRLAESLLKDTRTLLTGMKAILLEEHPLWRKASDLVGETVTNCLVVYHHTITEQSKHVPATADQLAKGVLEESKGLLAEVRATFDADHPLWKAVSDFIAGIVRECMVDYGKETRDWWGCIPVLESAAGVAVGEQVRSRLQKDIGQARRAADVKADRVYEVTISSRIDGIELPEGGGVLHRVLREEAGLRASVPNMCTCCLGPSSGEEKVSHEWEETRGLTKYKRSLSFNFPICEACRSHQAEYSNRRFLLVVLAAGISIGIVFLVAVGIPRPEWLQFVLAGGVLTILLTFLLSAMIRLSMLPEQHACRTQAVEMPEASGSQVVFRFHNPLYADAFAQSNGVEVRECRMRKPPRGSHMLAGRGAFALVVVTLVLGGIGHSILYAVGEDAWWRSSRRQTRFSAPTPSRTVTLPQPSTPSRTYTAPQFPTPSRADSGLSTKINSGKLRIQTLEADIKRMDSELESLSMTLARHKRGIEAWERLARSGQRPDESAYTSTIENHNRIVRQYNSLLSERNAKVSEYQREIKSVNDMVDRCNRGER